jgi:hypothetical protein
MQSTPTRTTSLRSTLIILFYLQLSFPSILLFQGFSTKILFAFFLSLCVPCFLIYSPKQYLMNLISIRWTTFFRHFNAKRNVAFQGTGDLLNILMRSCIFSWSWTILMQFILILSLYLHLFVQVTCMWPTLVSDLQEQKRKLFHTSVYDSELQLKKLYIQTCKRLPAHGCKVYQVKELLRGKTKKKVSNFASACYIAVPFCSTQILVQSPDITHTQYVYQAPKRLLRMSKECSKHVKR